MNLIDDKYLITTNLRRYVHLFNQLTNILDAVVRSGIQFVDVVRPLLVESLAGFALFAGIAIGFGVEAVDGLGKDAGAGGLAHSARSAEKVGVCQSSRLNGVFQRSGQCRLANHRVESHRTVFAC